MIMKNTDPTLGTSKEVVLDNSALKARYPFVSHEQNSGKNKSVRDSNTSFETVGKPDIWSLI
jgi:hypothetical protein